MTPEEYRAKIAAIRAACDKELKAAAREYAMTLKAFDVGDIVKDHLGGILIERIGYYISSFTQMPAPLYYGPELKKDGTLKKKGIERAVYPNNIVE